MSYQAQSTYPTGETKFVLPAASCSAMNACVADSNFAAFVVKVLQTGSRGVSARAGVASMTPARRPAKLAVTAMAPKKRGLDIDHPSERHSYPPLRDAPEAS